VNDQRTLGRSGDEYTPLPVEGLDDIKIVKVACSDSLTVALTDDGHVYTWGTFRVSRFSLLAFMKGLKFAKSLLFNLII